MRFSKAIRRSDVVRLALFGCITLMLSTAEAQTFSVLHSFQGTDGSYPLGGLVFGKNGILYGTTESGGTGEGTAYSITPHVNGGLAESVIYNFNSSGGQGPSSSLVSSNGVLYGTAPEGGTAGAGTVFELSPGAAGAPWTQTVLYNFQAITDGRGPFAGLTLGLAGVLYGTTTYGGNASCISGLGCGTVFQLTPPAVVGNPWTEAVLYRFQLGADGINPSAGVALASDGSLYGTASGGGQFEGGVVFHLTPPAVQGGAWTESVIYSFASGADGEQPLAPVVISKGGDLYGTTLGGGSAGCGTVFELTPPAVPGNPWNKYTIHSFTCTDGAYPESAVLLKPGVLYGTASGGGSFGAGTIYSLTVPAMPGTPWTETTLHNFQSSSDGSNPVGNLISGVGTALLGTAMSGGSNNMGTVFKLIP